MEEKSTAEKMAEFIYKSDIDCCRQCCADFNRCNKDLVALYDAHADEENFVVYMPKEHCIANIIKFFKG